jgi:laccase
MFKTRQDKIFIYFLGFYLHYFQLDCTTSYNYYFYFFNISETYTVKVKRGKTYLLRVINAALNTQHFFTIANHSLTVVAMDAIYTEHYNTDVLVLAPGQTVDVLLRTNQVVDSYYMVFTPYRSSNVSINNITTRGVIVYDGASITKTPIMPILPDAFDTPKAHKFYTNVTGMNMIK